MTATTTATCSRFAAAAGLLNLLADGREFYATRTPAGSSDREYLDSQVSTLRTAARILVEDGTLEAGLFLPTHLVDAFVRAKAEAAAGEPSPTAQEMVAEFHRTFGHPIAPRPALVDQRLAQLRLDLIVEESTEFEVATRERDLVEIADALADLVYVCYGAALCYGIDLDAVLAEVHRSNMSKLGADGRPVLRADGKVLKSDLFSPPDIAGVLDSQRDLS